MTIETSPSLILVADDDAGDRALIRRALVEGGFGREIVTVNDGEEALNYLMRQGNYQDLAGRPLPDLLILDLNMPRVDGKQVLQAMSEDATLKTIPVVVFTTSDQSDDISESYDRGAWYYMVKPMGVAGYARMVEVLRGFWGRLNEMLGQPT